MPAKPSDAPPRRSRSTGAATGSGSPPLSLERIIATAVELLDTQGVDGLSMRRLADRLGAGAMSLYWHVGNKEEVNEVAGDLGCDWHTVNDAVLAYGPPTVEARDWRANVVHMLEDWRAAMLRHPWSAALLPRRALGPSMLGRLELLSQALSRAGVADADLNVAIWSVWNYVMGATITRGSFDRSADDLAAAQRRLTERAERYPSIDRSRLLLDSDWDGAFKKGLDLLLDGLTPKR